MCLFRSKEQTETVPPTPEEYERLRRAARTHREELVVRLAGEAGLRPAEQARLRPADVLEHDDVQLIAVQSESTAAARAAGESVDPARESLLPDGVAHDLQQYAASNGIADDEALFSVSARRLAMLVREVADRVDGVDATAPELRDYFAASLLADGVPVHVVAALGGWERLDSLAPLLSEVDRGTLVGVAENEQESESVSGLSRAVLAATRDLPQALHDAEDRESVAGTVCDRLAAVSGVRFAWVADRAGETVTLREVAGVPERAVREGARSIDDVLAAAYDRDLGANRALAARTVRAHLEKLAARDRVRFDPDADRVTPA